MTRGYVRSRAAVRLALVVALGLSGLSPSQSNAGAENPTPAVLDALTTRISDDLPALSALGIAVVAPDPAAGVVRVTVTRDLEDARRVIAARYDGPIEVIQGEALEWLAAPPCPQQRKACGPVMRGGLELLGDSFATCSSGVEARLNSTREIGVLTAGHCFDDGELVMHAGVPLGPALPSVLGGEVDAAFVTHSFGAPTYLPSNWVFYSNAAQALSVTGVQPVASEAVGQSVCRTGITTGPRCGSITAVNATVVIGTITLRNQRIANTCALPGDSGGPFLSGGTFRGIASAGNFKIVNGTPVCDAAPFTTYSAAQRIQSTLGVTVLTSSPLL